MKEMEREQMSQDELKKMRRMSYIKMVAMVGIVGTVLAFSSIAWFTMSREVEGSGVKMTAVGSNYELTMLGNSNGLYYDDYHSQVIDSEAVVWTMRADANDGANGFYSGNFGNYTHVQDDGIYPGSSGCMSFNITPLVDGDLSLEFTFELLGYNAETEEEVDNGEVGNNQDAPEIQMVELDTSNDADVINYLNGHILLFEDYDSSTQKYSGLIGSSDDLTRVLNKTFNGKNQAETVNIYWVWPLTLSTIVAADDDVVTLCTGDDYNELESFVLSKPQYFMKNITTSVENPLTLQMIRSDYSLYGGQYDQSDNIIGARVRYLRLKMTIK